MAKAKKAPAAKKVATKATPKKVAVVGTTKITKGLTEKLAKDTTKAVEVHVAPQPVVPKYKTRSTVDKELREALEINENLKNQLTTSSSNFNTLGKKYESLVDKSAKENEASIERYKAELKEAKNTYTKVYDKAVVKHNRKVSDMTNRLNTQSDVIIKLLATEKSQLSSIKNLNTVLSDASSEIGVLKVKLNIAEDKRAYLIVERNNFLSNILEILNKPWYTRIFSSTHKAIINLL